MAFEELMLARKRQGGKKLNTTVVGKRNKRLTEFFGDDAKVKSAVDNKSDQEDEGIFMDLSKMLLEVD